jgi:hypothetical protein
VSQTTVRANLLQALQVFTQFRVNTIGKDLQVFSINNVLLPVQEPCRDLELSGILDDRHYTLKLIRVEFTSPDIPSNDIPKSEYFNAPLVKINICLFANNIRIPAANTLDFSQSVHDLAFSVNIGVEKTKNVL